MTEKFLVYPGESAPLGLSFQGDRANFALYSSHASKVTLGVRNGGKVQEIPLERTGDVWHAAVSGLSQNMEYAFRIEGQKANGSLFNPDNWLADPYSRYPSTHLKWGEGTGSVWSFCKLPPLFD